MRDASATTPRASRLILGVTLASLLVSACHDEANYVALGVCIGILLTGGFVIAFLETWLHLVRKCERTEQGQLEAHAAPETQR